MNLPPLSALGKQLFMGLNGTYNVTHLCPTGCTTQYVHSWTQEGDDSWAEAQGGFKMDCGLTLQKEPSTAP